MTENINGIFEKLLNDLNDIYESESKLLEDIKYENPVAAKDKKPKSAEKKKPKSPKGGKGKLNRYYIC